jgi:hypothetical protein
VLTKTTKAKTPDKKSKKSKKKGGRPMDAQVSGEEETATKSKTLPFGMQCMGDLLTDGNQRNIAYKNRTCPAGIKAWRAFLRNACSNLKKDKRVIHTHTYTCTYTHKHTHTPTLSLSLSLDLFSLSLSLFFLSSPS